MLVGVNMLYLKKNTKIKQGYVCSAIYDFNARETYLLSVENGQLLLAGEVEQVNCFLNGALQKAGLCTSDENMAEKNATYFDYCLFDDYKKYENCDTVYFEVTNKCNFNCIHCYADMSCDGQEFLSVAQMEQYIEHLDIKDKINIRLTGGEPFLNPHIRELIDLVSRRVTPVQRHSIVTNGSGKYEDLLYALESGFEVQISLYGMCEDTFRNVARVDTKHYSTMRKNLERLSQTKYADQIICLFSINSLTYHEMEPFVNTMQDMGLRVILNRSSSVGRANTNWEKLRLTPEQHMTFSRYNYAVAKGFNRYCYHACKLSWAYVDIFGNVKPCAFIRNDFCFGNLKNNHFRDLRKTKAFEGFKWMNADSFDKCNKCELEYCCTGGCCGETLVHEGAITNSYIWCVVRPYENSQYVTMNQETLLRVRKYAGGTFDFFQVIE